MANDRSLRIAALVCAAKAYMSFVVSVFLLFFKGGDPGDQGEEGKDLGRGS